MNVWNDTAATNRRANDRVELLVTADRKENVAWCDALGFEVCACVAGELEDLGGEVLHQRGSVDGGTRPAALVAEEAGLQAAMDAADGELEARASRAGLGRALAGFAGGLADRLSLAFSFALALPGGRVGHQVVGGGWEGRFDVNFLRNHLKLQRANQREENEETHFENKASHRPQKCLSWANHRWSRVKISL